MTIELENQVIDITAKKISQLQSVDKSNLVNTSLLYIVGKDEHHKLKSYKLDLNETDESKMILPTKDYLDRRISELGLNDAVLVYGLQQIQGQKTFTQYPFCIDSNNLDEEIYNNALVPKRYVIELISRMSDPSNPGVNDFVHKTGTETISGEKTFTILPQVTEVVGDRPEVTKDNQFIYKGYLEKVVDDIKSDLTNNFSNNLVHKTGTETIIDEKIFSKGCRSNVDPSGPNDLTRKNYVDNELNIIKNTSSPTSSINDFVHKTGNEYITGNKRFTGSIEFNPAKNPDNSYHDVVFYRYPKLITEEVTSSRDSIMNKGYIDDLDGVNVKKVGNQSIRGIKTFVDLPKVAEVRSGVYPDISSTDQFIYKGYLDSKISELNATIDDNDDRAVTRENEIVRAIYGSNEVGARAVLVTGNQVINGTKTFSNVPRCDSLNPYDSIDNNDLLTKYTLIDALTKFTGGEVAEGSLDLNNYLKLNSSTSQSINSDIRFNDNITFVSEPILNIDNISNYSENSNKLINYSVLNELFTRSEPWLTPSGVYKSDQDYQSINSVKIINRDLVFGKVDSDDFPRYGDSLINDLVGQFESDGNSVESIGLYLGVLNFGLDQDYINANKSTNPQLTKYSYENSIIRVTGTNAIEFKVENKGTDSDPNYKYVNTTITNIPEVTGSTNITKSNQLTTKSYVDAQINNVSNIINSLESTVSNNYNVLNSKIDSTKSTLEGEIDDNYSTLNDEITSLRSTITNLQTLVNSLKSRIEVLEGSSS